ncbi:DEAD/DEAH box helicase [Mesonia maritima]|uniref:DEAD/DEAH box helicase n=1 Tax=Mesonia maritima TaxID=1793873 RepID=UPI00362CAF75
MIIENSPFEDYPIEFKEINPSDFHSEAENGINSFNIENNGSKAIIETNAEGYINDAFQEAINLDRKNTVVVNAAVGQGKSTAIINTLKKYYEKMRNGEDKYLMIVASPFVSLVKQYVNEIEKAGIPANEIYNYNKLGRDRENYRTRCVQVVTVNTLLGNPGEDGFKNSDVKRKYLNELVSDAKRYEKKVIFIYDEVHDSYHNFKSEFIYNLWKWREVIHKNFILSATYNEASKVVIKYLAELTENRLLLIESKRKRREKQSELFLHFSNSYRFTSHMDELQDLIEDLLNRERNIDILSYSKSLAKDILNPKEKLGKLLIDRFGELNDCTSQLIMNNRNENEEPKNQFDNNKCNVGTNFKTGVSIKKSNHSYIIILPPRFTRDFFRNKFGIFSGGINSVIQALARQRRPGEIHLILAKPDKFNFESLPFSNWTQDQMLFFARIYKYVQYSKEPPNGLVKYFKINRQNELIKDFYQNELLENVKNEINFISEKNRSNLPKLQYPTYDEFLLEKGEDYLANNYQFFGEDISSYITYAALTNQFSNCKLSFIGNKITLYFRKETILEDLSKFYRDYVDEYYSRHFTNFNFFYLDLRTRIFKDFGLRYLHFVNSANGTEEMETSQIISNQMV